MRDLPTSEGRAFVELGHRVLDRLSSSRLISIAAINGFALGGGAELALACDLRIAAEGAKVGFPEVRLGLFPAWGGTQRLARLVGPSRARLLVFTGDQLTATESLAIGLVDRTVPDAGLIDECNRVARRIAEAAPRAVEQAKHALLVGGGQPMDIGKRIEIDSWLVNFATRDRVEGLSAFLDKRSPNWADE
jgi:enoyl-CoA hydratase